MRAGHGSVVYPNDRFANGTATLATVSLSQQSSANAGVSLDVTSGAVTVAAGTSVGTYALRYAICEAASPSNCDCEIAMPTNCARATVRIDLSGR